MEFVLDRDMIFAITGDQWDVDHRRSRLKSSLFQREKYGPLIQRKENPKNELVAVDAHSGQERWRLGAVDMEGYQGASIGAIGDRVVFSAAPIDAPW